MTKNTRKTNNLPIMKTSTTPFRITLTVVLLLLTFNSYSQNNSLVLNGAYIVLDGGSVTNNISLVIDQPNPLGIFRLPAGGHIHSENQYNYVKWITAASTGNYLFPFGIGGNSADYIPFTFNKTAGTSNIMMST
ncbi:MAG: hypothetical protein HYU68_07600, partial [Bacteroidetes bacterium]|nr:hypothetical protein [Bacteroidota bacterium]